MKNISLLLLFFSLIIGSASADTVLILDNESSGKNYYLLRLHIVADVQEDGTVKMSETRTMAFEGSYSWFEQIISKAGYSEMSGISAYDNDIPLQLSSENDEGTYRIRDRRNSIEIRWNFRAKDEKRTFRLDYVLHDAISIDTDWSEFYWTFVGNKWEKATSDITLEIRLPQPLNSEEVFVWKPNPFDNQQLKINEGVITFTTERLRSKRSLRLQTVFPSRILQPEVNTDAPINPFAIQAEKDREYEAALRKEARKAELAPMVRAVGFLSILFSLIITVYFVNKYGRNGAPGFLPPTWMEAPPSDLKPAIIGMFMGHGHLGGNQIAATVLDLARQGFFRIRQGKTGKGTLFSPEKDEYTLELTDKTPDSKTSREWEITLYEYLRDRVKDGHTTFSKIFKSDYLSSKSHQSFSKKVHEELKSKEWRVHQPKVVLAQVAIQTVVLVIGILLLIFGTNFVWGLLTIIFAAMGYVMCAALYPRTDAGQKTYLEWKAYRSALKDGKVSKKPELKGLHIIYAVTFYVSGKHFKGLTDSLSFDESDISWMLFMPGVTFNSMSLSSAVGGLVTSTTASVSASAGGASAGSAGGGGGGGAG